MPCSRYARQTGAVPSGRNVSERPPLSSKVYISFWTMSVASPTPRANSSVASNVGVSIRRYPAAPRIFSACASTTFRRAADSGRMSNVPRGACITERSPLGELAQERVRRALAPKRGEAHVARIDRRLVRVRAEQALDRGQQRRPVAAREVDPPDRSLEEHVA